MSAKEQGLGAVKRDYEIFGRSNLAGNARTTPTADANRLPWPTTRMPAIGSVVGANEFKGTSVLDMVEKIMRVVEVQSTEPMPMCDEPAPLQLVHTCVELEEAPVLPLQLVAETGIEAEHASVVIPWEEKITEIANQPEPVVTEPEPVEEPELIDEADLADEAELIELVNESELIDEPEMRIEAVDTESVEEPPTEIRKLQREEKQQPGTVRTASLFSKLAGWLKNQFVTRQSKKRLRVCETVSLGEKRFVAVIQVDGEQFLVGGAANSVATLARLEAQPEFADVLKRRWTPGAVQA